MTQQSTSKTLKIYADLNCPFCYALHQRFSVMQKNGEVLPDFDWCLIEHAQDIEHQVDSLHEQSILATEVFHVRHRAPEITIAMPPARPNTHKATMIVIELERRDSEQAQLVREAFYEALWIDGLNLDDDKVITSVCHHAGLKQVPVISPSSREKLKAQQQNWQQGQFEGRIPSMDFGDNKPLLGLPTPVELLHFLGGQELPLNLETACLYRPRPSLLILGNLNKHWRLLDELRHHKDIHPTHNLNDLLNTLQEPERPNLLVIEHHFAGINSIDACAKVREDYDSFELPIAIILDHPDEELEENLYQAGANDVILTQKSTAIFNARVELLIKIQTTLAQLTKTARIDHLTEVYSRAEFEWVMEVEWRRGQRGRTNLALLMVDIDHFKDYNDHYGHLAGDDILRKIAQALQHHCQRASDIVARYGGEEFAVILPNTDSEGAAQIAEQMRAAIEQLKIPSHDKKKPVSVSVGIAITTPDKTSSPNELVDLADKALYLAKKNGRNQIAASP
jgi:diguanylate cyclase (GGDEF)-like protein